jgi:DNA-binding NarL/FixJ family response regulator
LQLHVAVMLQASCPLERTPDYSGLIWNQADWYVLSDLSCRAVVRVNKCKHTLVLGQLKGGGESLEKDVLNQKCRLQSERLKGRIYWRRIAVMDIERMKVTPRDQQVLDLLVQGCSNKEIAGQLSISPRTVKQHLRTLFLRAGIRDGRKRVRLATAAFEKTELKS